MSQAKVDHDRDHSFKKGDFVCRDDGQLGFYHASSSKHPDSCYVIFDLASRTAQLTKLNRLKKQD